MKIGFVNYTPMVYNVDTPYKEPLGGSESAMCYLTPELAKLGHTVVLFGRYLKKFSLKGVVHENQNRIGKGKWHDLDFMIIQNHPKAGEVVKPLLGKKTKLVLWEHLDIDQPVLPPLHDPQTRSLFDRIVFVSNWQMERYIDSFDIDRGKSTVLKNAVSPVFENLFAKDEKILEKKDSPPSLIYSTTPFRGLGLLINIFPQIRNLMPGTRFKVFSSLKVYQGSKKEEEPYQKLYELCRSTEGVIYHESVSQTQLAKELVTASILAYPCLFPETSSITVMEAMAAGCRVITGDLGALRETTAGFAQLIPFTGDLKKYGLDFAIRVISEIRKFLTNDQKLESDLSKQVNFVKDNYTWSKRAREWEKWLESLPDN
jgi:glycosyltransferase involved in cell wall biosynthesis